MSDEPENVASAEVSAPEPVTIDSALETLNAQDETPVATEPAEAEPEVEETEKAEPSTEEAEASPDADPDAPEYLHGNARTRLRDGSEVTIGELKKAYDEAKEYRVKQTEFETRQRDFETKQAQIAAQETYFTQTINQAKAVLQANFPPKPDYAAVERGELDEFTFTVQKAKYDNAVEKWQGLQRAEQTKAQQAEAARQQEHKAYVAKEYELLQEKIPELRTEEGRKAFKAEVMDIATKEYDFGADELANMTDHRALRVLKDAIAYRKLQAAKPKALDKVKDVPPVQVQAPGRRVAPAEKHGDAVKQGFERLRKTGSFDDALAILNQMET